MVVDLVSQVSAVIVLCAVFGLLARFVKQPLLLGYILAGVVIGPQVLGLVQDVTLISLMSELGVAFLLFMVGLELDVKKLKHLGSVSIVAGLGQVIFTFLVGYVLGRWLGVSASASFLIALGLTLSSTAVVVKLLSDLKRLDTLTGRVSLGILLVQDVVALILLAVASASAPSSSAVTIGLNIVGLSVGVVLVGVFLLSRVFGWIAKSGELLFLTSVSWCLLAAGAAVYLGLSVAMGAFLAGISLANIPYNVEIISRTRALRDFFATIFFASLGLQLSFASLAANSSLILILSAFVIVGNPLILFLLMSVLGFPSRVSFSTGLALSQVSEFSVIIMAMGVKTGLVTQELFSVMVLIAVITFASSTYLIWYDAVLYEWLEPLLKPFESLSFISRSKDEGVAHRGLKPYAIVCGANRVGGAIVEALHKTHHVLAVDYDPRVVERLKERGIPTVYGDISEDDVLERLPFKSARIAIITSSNLPDSLVFLRHVRRMNKKLKVFCTASNAQDALELYAEGASYVIVPFHVGGEHALNVLGLLGRDVAGFSSLKRRHVVSLREKVSRGV